jgi:hypothetical protein
MDCTVNLTANGIEASRSWSASPATIVLRDVENPESDGMRSAASSALSGSRARRIAAFTAYDYEYEYDLRGD